MELNDYQMSSLRYRLPTASHEYCVLGLSGEVGELHGMLAKSIRDSKPIDIEYLKKELGDVLWFVSALAADFGFTLEDVAVTNVAKLESRAIRNTIIGSGDDR